MANDYDQDVEALIASLHKPRYATPEAPAFAPVLFDGVLQGEAVTFVAHKNDPHQHGIDVWQNAQDGMYGAIGPYTPGPIDIPGPPTAQASKGAHP
jgi:hypothetical protein